MFTNGQKTRMLAALTSSTASRNNLWSSSNLTATGVNTNTVCSPAADFYAETPQICVNSSINFIENTNLAPATAWSWSFPGGTPSTSTDQNPTVQYSTAGTYSVSLTVTNANGSSSITKNSYISVQPSTADITVPSFSEGFESLVVNAASNWSINNLDGGVAWAITSNAAYTGTKSIKLNNINNTPGSIDEFITPSMDLTQFANPRLYYKIAYASLTGTAGVDYQSNSLQILSSVDCGKTWGVRRSYTENTLSTTTDQDAAFTPNSQSKWREDNISLALFTGYNNIQFKFRFEAGEGNNIYIDDINMNNTTPVLEVESIKNNFRISPNPTEGDAIIYFSTESNSNATIKVFDILGKEVYQNNMGNVSAGNHQLQLSKNEVMSTGIYFVQLSLNDLVLTKKLILK
jgi:PKD repeat protein